MSREDRQTPPEGPRRARRRKAKKVAILGFAESYKKAPFDDPDCEIWGLNELAKYLPRWDRFFELHDDKTLGVTKRDLQEGEVKRHLEWLSVDYGPDKIIYMQPQFCDGRFPNAKAYPLEQMSQLFGRYFTSTVGYMLALAIAEDFPWIGLYGVDLASDVEYPYQRPNTEYLVGIARGQGREIVVPEEAALLKAGFLYGFEEPPGDSLKTSVSNHMSGLRKRHAETLAMLHTLDGAIQETENTLKLFTYKARGVSFETY